MTSDSLYMVFLSTHSMLNSLSSLVFGEMSLTNNLGFPKDLIIFKTLAPILPSNKSSVVSEIVFKISVPFTAMHF